MAVLSNMADEFRVAVEPVCVSLDLFFKIVGLCFRQVRLMSELVFERGARRRYSLRRRLDQVILKLEGMK